MSLEKVMEEQIQMHISLVEHLEQMENRWIAGMDLFHRGLCLPSDNKMTVEEQAVVIEIIRRCFK